MSEEESTSLTLGDGNCIINELHDSLLGHIMSRMPLKDAVRIELVSCPKIGVQMDLLVQSAY